MEITSDRPSQAVDRLLAASFLALTQVEIWVFTADEAIPPAIRIGASIAAAAASLPLAWRRSRPFPAFLANSLAVVVAIAIGYPSDFYQWTNLITTYSVAAHGTARQAWLSLPMALAGVASYFLRFPAEGGALIAGFAIAMWMIGWLAGRVYGSRVEQLRIAAERDMSVQLARARDERLQTEQQRTQVARELHDAIGHGVNVMVIHAGAGRMAIDSDPDAARRSFETIEQTGRRAMDELDRVLTLLRDGEAEPATRPSPGLGDIPELLSTFRGAGMKVHVDVEYEDVAVPQSVALNAFRIVQESLTNVSRHSQDGWAYVDLKARPGSLDLEVRSAPAEDPPREGRGLIGMRERAALHGGDLTVSSTSEHFSVFANLTWEEA